MGPEWVGTRVSGPGGGVCTVTERPGESTLITSSGGADGFRPACPSVLHKQSGPLGSRPGCGLRAGQVGVAGSQGRHRGAAGWEGPSLSRASGHRDGAPRSDTLRRGLHSGTLLSRQTPRAPEPHLGPRSHRSQGAARASESPCGPLT